MCNKGLQEDDIQKLHTTAPEQLTDQERLLSTISSADLDRKPSGDSLTQFHVDMDHQHVNTITRYLCRLFLCVSCIYNWTGTPKVTIPWNHVFPLVNLSHSDPLPTRKRVKKKIHRHKDTPSSFSHKDTPSSFSYSPDSYLPPNLS